MQRQTRTPPSTTNAASAERAPGPSPDAQPRADGQDALLDALLIQGVLRADREALGRLYDRQAPLLLALALRLLGDREAAELVLHDLFVDVWHHASEYDVARTSVRAWLVGRLRALALARRGPLPPAEPPPQAAGIVGLPAELAQVLELTYFAGLPLAAAAERLGLPPELVRERLARAMTLLRHRVAAGEEGTS